MDLGGGRVQRRGAPLGPAHDHRALGRGDDEGAQPATAFLAQSVPDEQGGERLLPASEDGGGGPGGTGCLVVGLHGHRDDRTARPEVAAHQLLTPQREERVHGRDRVVRLRGGVDQPRDEVPGVRHRLVDELRPPTGKVVVHRAPGSAAVREHLVDTRPARAVLAQQGRGTENHPLPTATLARTHPPTTFPTPRCGTPPADYPPVTYGVWHRTCKGGGWAALLAVLPTTPVATWFATPSPQARGPVPPSRANRLARSGTSSSLQAGTAKRSSAVSSAVASISFSRARPVPVSDA